VREDIASLRLQPEAIHPQSGDLASPELALIAQSSLQHRPKNKNQQSRKKNDDEARASAEPLLNRCSRCLLFLSHIKISSK
jgi:hypothetical protein